MMSLAVQMDGQIIAIQQRAAMSGRGPAAWAVGARCTASLPPDDTWAEVIIRNVSSQGKCIVQTMESALQSSLTGEPSTPSVFAEVSHADTPHHAHLSMACINKASFGIRACLYEGRVN